MKPIGAVLAASLILSPGLAHAYRSPTQNDVVQVSGSVWEVLARPGTSAANYWCSAGDFAIRQLGAQAVQRVFIWQPLGPSTTRPGTKSVQFSFSAPEGANTTPGYSLSVKNAGDNLTAAAAQQYCFDRLPIGR